ncbi:MAG: hypothetical protein VB070_05455 [Clostridiaceae bacterium]|nr:hypothetical protein [Clostridiaceae bacterium]
MPRNFGDRNIVRFHDDHEFFIALGYLANPTRGIRFDWEDYENKWGIEGRIWIRDSTNAPDSLRNAFSAGTRYCQHRLNCNQYLAYIIQYHNFPNGLITDFDSIRETVPAQFLNDFDFGVNL